jgi:hypothetical protein
MEATFMVVKPITILHKGSILIELIFMVLMQDYVNFDIDEQ